MSSNIIAADSTVANGCGCKPEVAVGGTVELAHIMKYAHLQMQV
jgi:hypothetical protein